MTATLEVLHRPTPDVDYRVPSPQRQTGFLVALIGLILAVATLVANLVAASLLDGSAGEVESAEQTLAWSFGLTTTAFATIKVAIALILIGIVYRLWMRVDSVKTALHDLRPDIPSTIGYGDIETPYGAASVTPTAPKPLPIHTMAKRMWAPMVAMGGMAVIAGLIASVVWALSIGNDPGDVATAAAWTQGLQFLGEGFLLAGIAFLLGTILSGLRNGGGEVQESLGVPVRTLKMPTTAKAFVVLMMLGLMVSITQFVFYVGVGSFDVSSADDLATIASWSAWLGPFRELGLGLILSGIVLALATIARVLGYQFGRVREIIATGQ
jgi:hypothetical protein